MNATNPQYPHKFNPMGPAGYLLTFHTYGTWLHGDPRGSMDRKGHTIPGTPVIPSDQARLRAESSRLKQQPVTFTVSQRESIDRTIHEVSAFNKWLLHAINVRTEHVHVVITALKSPESVMNSFKSWCTRRMRENRLWINVCSPWSRHGSIRYLWNEKDIRAACRYVLYAQTE